jgi:NAD-dependent dihydropyrimidine dehydrogenase PreA subunit
VPLVNEEMWRGRGICVENRPADAILMEVGEMTAIDMNDCIHFLISKAS